MRKLVLATLLGFPLLASAATNLITNGSFESGLANWSVTGTAPDGYPATVITYNTPTPYPNGAFGEAVPTDTAVNLGPDAAGTQALYFVSDFSTEIVSQSFTVPTSGLYTFGLDVYLPANGFANAVNATFGIKLGSINLGTFPLSSFAPTAWTPGTTAVNLVAGVYNVALSFNSDGKPAKDIVIDKVYLISSVPEAGTPAMLLAGLAGIGFVAARRRSNR
jgi:PEP-CTERM motif